MFEQNNECSRESSKVNAACDVNGIHLFHKKAKPCPVSYSNTTVEISHIVRDMMITSLEYVQEDVAQVNEQERQLASARYKKRINTLKVLLEHICEEMSHSVPPDDGRWFEETENMIERLDGYLD